MPSLQCTVMPHPQVVLRGMCVCWELGVTCWTNSAVCCISSPAAPRPLTRHGHGCCMHTCPADPTSYDFGTVRYGKLSFVDLAGSERVKDSRSEGSMLKETININKSLSVLGKVHADALWGRRQEAALEGHHTCCPPPRVYAVRGGPRPACLMGQRKWHSLQAARPACSAAARVAPARAVHMRMPCRLPTVLPAPACR